MHRLKTGEDFGALLTLFMTYYWLEMTRKKVHEMEKNTHTQWQKGYFQFPLVITKVFEMWMNIEKYFRENVRILVSHPNLHDWFVPKLHLTPKVAVFVLHTMRFTDTCHWECESSLLRGITSHLADNVDNTLISHLKVSSGYCREPQVSGWGAKDIPPPPPTLLCCSSFASLWQLKKGSRMSAVYRYAEPRTEKLWR